MRTNLLTMWPKKIYFINNVQSLINIWMIGMKLNFRLRRYELQVTYMNSLRNIKYNWFHQSTTTTNRFIQRHFCWGFSLCYGDFWLAQKRIGFFLQWTHKFHTDSTIFLTFAPIDCIFHYSTFYAVCSIDCDNLRQSTSRIATLFFSFHIWSNLFSILHFSRSLSLSHFLDCEIKKK